MKREDLHRHELCEVCDGYGWNDIKRLVPVDFDKMARQHCANCGGMGYVNAKEFVRFLYEQGQNKKPENDHGRKRKKALAAFRRGKISEMPPSLRGKPRTRPFRRPA